MNSRVSWRRILVVVGLIVVPVVAWQAVVAARESQEAAWGMTILVMFGLPIWLLAIFLRHRFKNRVVRTPSKGKDGLDSESRN
jgi:putative copper export protein